MKKDPKATHLSTAKSAPNQERVKRSYIVPSRDEGVYRWPGEVVPYVVEAEAAETDVEDGITRGAGTELEKNPHASIQDLFFSLGSIYDHTYIFA